MEANFPKILIVDDVANNIQVVGNVLRSEKYRIAFAQNGRTALQQIKNSDFNLILLDIMMPEMSGIEVCRRIKEMPEKKDIPVVFLTAKSDIDSISEAFRVGGVDYITKPFNSKELLVRVKTHISLQQQSVELKRLNATKDKLFSIVSHDLKGFFFTILGAGEILRSRIEKFDPDDKKFIEMMFRGAKNAFNLLENLLEWSRSQLGRIEFAPEKIRLNEVIHTATTLLEMSAANKQIKITHSIDSEIFIYADMNMLSTIVRNLVSNAIKFTDKNGEIKISSRILHDFVEISIADSGIGISKEDLENLFKIEKQISRKGTKGEIGTGLGLLLCKEFIEKHGGTIHVDSRIGKGSVFRFTFPLAEQNMSEEVGSQQL